MSLTSVFKDLIQHLKDNHLPLNMFNLLSSIEERKFIHEEDWIIFKTQNDVLLFERIMNELSHNVKLNDAINYLISTESIYSSALSDFMIKQKNSSTTNTHYLEQYGYNLRNLQKETCLHREEVQELIKVCLNRNYKNNIMLIGSPGIGKTFLIASIAHMLNIDIYYIDISKILSGTQYRGEFEKKFHAILDEALKQKTVLFFDEAHAILNTGNSEGGISGADILKPYLMNNNFQIIAATTKQEAAVFAHDKAFERRFNFIHLKELSPDNTRDIVKSKFIQTMAWEQSRLDEIFSYLDTHCGNRNYPDKAIDFFDFYFTGEKLSLFQSDNFNKVFHLFTQMNNCILD